MVLFLKNVFSALIVDFFWRKIRNILNLEKLENTMKKEGTILKTLSGF